MNYIFNDKQKSTSIFIAENYFPAIIEFPGEESRNRFIEFNYRDSDMFEFSTNPFDGTLKRFSLTLCNHYSIKTENIREPEALVGSIIINGPDKTECDIFNALIYNNGIVINTSKSLADKYCKCGQLIFGFTSANKLVSLCVVDLSPNDIDHIKRELIH